jgi:DNA-binding MarR family transcriptional regulator
VTSSKSDAAEIRRAIEALQRLADLLGERRSQLAREAGLTEQQWRVLEEIAAPGFLPSLFARRSETTPAAVSKVLRQLLEKGFVTVSIAEGDARQRAYEPTAKGRKALARIEAARAEAVASVWGRLELRDLSRFADLAEDLAGRLDAYARPRRPTASPRRGAAIAR